MVKKPPSLLALPRPALPSRAAGAPARVAQRGQPLDAGGARRRAELLGAPAPSSPVRCTRATWKRSSARGCGTSSATDAPQRPGDLRPKPTDSDIVYSQLFTHPSDGGGRFGAHRAPRMVRTLRKPSMDGVSSMPMRRLASRMAPMNWLSLPLKPGVRRRRSRRPPGPATPAGEGVAGAQLDDRHRADVLVAAELGAVAEENVTRALRICRTRQGELPARVRPEEVVEVREAPEREAVAEVIGARLNVSIDHQVAARAKLRRAQLERLVQQHHRVALENFVCRGAGTGRACSGRRPFR